MRTPRHFPSSEAFRRYIYDCAIRDREALIDAYAHGVKLENKEAIKITRQTESEIACMRKRKYEKQKGKS